MLSRFIWVLLSARSSLIKIGNVDAISGHALADYAAFGLPKIADLNALEQRTLDTLCKSCMACVCPELPQALIDRSAFRVDTNGRARCVVFSVLCEESLQRILGKLLDDTGFASHCLLAKLFNKIYIGGLQSATHNGGNLSGQFNGAIERCWAKLEPVVSYISTRVRATVKMDFRDYVARNGNRDTGFDLGVLGAMKQASERKGVHPEISKQIELWLAGECVSEELVSRISEVVRVIMHSDVLTTARVVSYRAYFTELVACSPHQELLQLLEAFHNSRSIQIYMTNILKNDGYRRICPEFVLNYLNWLKELGGDTEQVLNLTWRRYLKDGYALSHVLQLCENPGSFLEEVPQPLLYDSVRHLHAVADDIPRRDAALSIIMKSLSFHAFTRIIAKAERGGYQALMRFMLGYLDDGAKATYLAGAKATYLAGARNLKRSNGKAISPKFIEMHRDIEKELRLYWESKQHQDRLSRGLKRACWEGVFI
ncbi:hypothetical protein PAPHI01_2239 [Pancytospora philotis]|nr:hypothetical protein PAPHI01_2239 [Pancytospora philotis]